METKYINLFTDFGFKRIFGMEEDNTFDLKLIYNLKNNKYALLHIEESTDSVFKKLR